MRTKTIVNAPLYYAVSKTIWNLGQPRDVVSKAPNDVVIKHVSGIRKWTLFVYTSGNTYASCYKFEVQFITMKIICWRPHSLAHSCRGAMIHVLSNHSYPRREVFSERLMKIDLICFERIFLNTKPTLRGEDYYNITIIVKKNIRKRSIGYICHVVPSKFFTPSSSR